MRYVTITIFTLLTALLFISCDPCGWVDCARNNYNGQFRIVSAATAKDLVFGPAKIYDKSQIRFYSIKDADTTFFDYKPVAYPNIGYDSILLVYFYPETDIAYMRLSNGDVDTLAISYKITPGGRCCGAITEIANYRYNNMADLPGDQGTQELKK